MAENELRVEVRLEIPRAALDTETDVAGPDYVLGTVTELEPDPDLMEGRFVEPVTLVVVVTLSVLAERILHFALSRRGQGVLVDLRDKPPRMTNLAGVPQGTVLLVNADGTTTLEANTAPSTLTELLRGMLTRSG